MAFLGHSSAGPKSTIQFMPGFYRARRNWLLMNGAPENMSGLSILLRHSAGSKSVSMNCAAQFWRTSVYMDLCQILLPAKSLLANGCPRRAKLRLPGTPDSNGCSHVQTYQTKTKNTRKSTNQTNKTRKPTNTQAAY